jgi:hypothetical protein
MEDSNVLIWDMQMIYSVADKVSGPRFLLYFPAICHNPGKLQPPALLLLSTAIM